MANGAALTKLVILICRFCCVTGFAKLPINDLRNLQTGSSCPTGASNSFAY
jgi:hypothetical protein